MTRDGSRCARCAPAQPPKTELSDAAKLIHDRKLNGITVVNEHGDLVGILTTTNALEALIWFARQAAAGPAAGKAP